MEEYLRIAASALAQVIAAGADKAQCMLTVDKVDEVTAEANAFNLMRTYTDTRLTIKAIRGKKATSLIVNRTDPRSIKMAVGNCIAALDHAVEDEHADIAPLSEGLWSRRGALTGDVESMTGRLVELSRKIKEEYPKIVFECSGRYIHRWTVLVNSNGVALGDECGFYYIGASYVAKDGNETTSFGPGIHLRMLDPDVDYMGLPHNREEIQRALDSLHPSPFGEKMVGTVVATPTFASQVLRHVVENALTDVSITSGTSRLLGKIGERVASQDLTLAFEPGSSDIVLGEAFTPEGYPVRDSEVIKNGVLTEYMLTQYGAAKSGLTRGPNSGGAMCVRPGTKPLRDIIGGINRGVLLGRYSGTEPDVSGDLSGVAKNSFLIEDGKLTKPLVGTMVSANIFDMIQNISAISGDVRKTGTSVLPYVAFSGVTIK